MVKSVRGGDCLDVEFIVVSVGVVVAAVVVDGKSVVGRPVDSILSRNISLIHLGKRVLRGGVIKGYIDDDDDDDDNDDDGIVSRRKSKDELRLHIHIDGEFIRRGGPPGHGRSGDLIS